jgi:hypothetical protein
MRLPGDNHDPVRVALLWDAERIALAVDHEHGNTG